MGVGRESEVSDGGLSSRKFDSLYLQGIAEHSGALEGTLRCGSDESVNESRMEWP